MTPQEFANAVLAHQRFVAGRTGGKRAELRFVNLSGLRFPRINLSGAILTGINLSRSTLHDADLGFADLFCANLVGCDAQGSNFFRADMRGVQMHGSQAARRQPLRS